MSEMLDSALFDCRIVSVALANAKWTPIQRAVVGLTSIGISMASSIRELVRMGYIPSARILIRPLIERVALTEYISNNEAAAVDWNAGWPKGKNRPTLAQLLSLLEKGHKKDWLVYQRFMVDGFNAVIHPDPAGDKSFMAENEHGQSVYWFDTVPSAFELADNVCAATSMAAVFLASNAKRAFVYKQG